MISRPTVLYPILQYFHLRGQLYFVTPMEFQALLWQHDFNLAKLLFEFYQKDSLQKSLSLFSRSVSSFPDSWIARDAHLYRARIFEKQDKLNEAQLAKKKSR